MSPTSDNRSNPAECAENSATATLQREFAAYLRNPTENPAPPNIEARRLKVYRELVYNNIESFIASGFPVLHKIYRATDWHAMVRDFVCRHASRSPYFSELGREFIEYLEREHHMRDCDPPFLLELARYEWAELALFVADASLPAGRRYAADDSAMLDAVPQLSPLAWAMVFTYPVHKIGVDYQPSCAAAQQVCLVVYRNREERVKFLEVNLVTARLLELCETNRQLSGRELLAQIVSEMAHPDPATVVNGGRAILAQLHNLDIILFP